MALPYGILMEAPTRTDVAHTFTATFNTQWMQLILSFFFKFETKEVFFNEKQTHKNERQSPGGNNECNFNHAKSHLQTWLTIAKLVLIRNMLVLFFFCTLSIIHINDPWAWIF